MTIEQIYFFLLRDLEKPLGLETVGQGALMNGPFVKPKQHKPPQQLQYLNKSNAFQQVTRASDYQTILGALQGAQNIMAPCNALLDTLL